MLNRLGIKRETGITAVKYIFSLVMVILVGAVLIVFQGENPLTAFSAIVKGAFGNRVAIGNTIRWTTPWIITSMAAILAFKSEVENYGIEGQMYVGSLAAAFIGYYFELPAGIHIIACIAAAGIAGALWTILPALLKLYFKVDELIITLMMNYIAIKMTEYVTMWWIMGAARSETGAESITTPTINSTAKLSTLIKGTSATTGFYIAVVIAVLVYMLYKYTVKGYELKQLGDNMRFAKVNGVKCEKNFLMIFMLSGLVAGIAGGVEVLGSYNRFIASFASGTTGWNGIMIARICDLSPIGGTVVSFIWGALTTGGMNMERVTTLNRMVVNVVQVLFVLFVSVDYNGTVQKIKNKRMIKAQVRDNEKALTTDR